MPTDSHLIRLLNFELLDRDLQGFVLTSRGSIARRHMKGDSTLHLFNQKLSVVS
jgi:hypothetical protein